MNKKLLLTTFLASVCASSVALAAPTADQKADLRQMNAELAQMKARVNQLERQWTTEQHQQYLKKTGMEKNQKTQRNIGSKTENLQAALTQQSTGHYVVIAPFTSKPTFYSGGRLVVNAPSINEDAKLLYRRMLDQRLFLKEGRPLPPIPRLVLSGEVAGQVIYNNPYVGGYTSDIDLTDAELDSFVEVTPWVNAFMTLEYDNEPDSTDAGSGNRRISNSRVTLGKGFVTIGNFNKSGAYGSIGQMYVPFGDYGSNMITSPLTKYVGKTKARAVTLNYIVDPTKRLITPFGHVYLFKGDAKFGNDNLANQFGLSTGLWIGNDNTNGTVAVDFINNIADAEGMQDNGRNSGFRGFEKTSVSNSEQLTHRVSGLDFHGTFGFRSFSALGEFLTAMKGFSRNDMTYNNHSATPAAFNTEGSYAFTILQKIPASIAIGYGYSHEALALNIPHQRYIAAFQVTCLRDTTLSFELRHDINYGKHDSATGKGLTAYTQNELGKVDNGAKVELAVYF